MNKREMNKVCLGAVKLHVTSKQIKWKQSNGFYFFLHFLYFLFCFCVCSSCFCLFRYLFFSLLLFLLSMAYKLMNEQIDQLQLSHMPSSFSFFLLHFISFSFFIYLQKEKIWTKKNKKNWINFVWYFNVNWIQYSLAEHLVFCFYFFFIFLCDQAVTHCHVNLFSTCIRTFLFRPTLLLFIQNEKKKHTNTSWTQFNESHIWLIDRTMKAKQNNNNNKTLFAIEVYVKSIEHDR